MNELLPFTEAFGPVIGLILYIVQRHIAEMIARKADAENAARITRIEESLKRVENAVVPPLKTETEGPDVSKQPQT